MGKMFVTFPNPMILIVDFGTKPDINNKCWLTGHRLQVTDRSYRLRLIRAEWRVKSERHKKARV
ncbi:hypothetical protein BCT49_03775 [Vibrio lentus]|uniref:Uncharacterized protein n=1 Tax=Vibrio lentus TaxID=136468 RepID=A0A2N7KAJ8_9VIBR|nr:hypothetical protein BCT49_03775 [Vibrio lentus]